MNPLDVSPSRPNHQSSSQSQPCPSPNTHPAGLSSPTSTPPTRFRTLLLAAFTALIGAVLCQSLLGSLVVLGWIQRIARRATLREWWRSRAPHLRHAEGFRSFEEFASNNGETHALARWPTWIRHPSAANPSPRLLTRSLGGLVLNFRLGLAAAINTWILTLPGCLLWAIAWYDGWQNSFNKGYEHAWVGPTTFTIGTLLFAAAMIYVPMAQARQASAGSWRSFFDFKMVWHLVQRRWLGCLGVAALCTALNFPVLALKTYPAFKPQVIEAKIRELQVQRKPVPKDLIPVSELTPRQQLDGLKGYYLWSALVVFPALVLLRITAAKVHARALREAVQSGGIPAERLADWEWQALHRLGLTTPQTTSPKHRWIRFLHSLGTRSYRTLVGSLTLAVWLVFVGQVTVSEFFKYTDWGRGWWSQPLIQVPWFSYIPAHLEDAARHP